MPQFACFKADGSFHRTITAARKPDPNPKKGFVWYSVGEPREGDENGWFVDGDEAYRQTKAVPAASPRYVQKMVVWDRMTDQELGQAQAALDLLKVNNVRLYRQIMDLTIFDHEADYFPRLLSAFEKLYGKPRAAELLEAQN